jgi:hypothetical protein
MSHVKDFQYKVLQLCPLFAQTIEDSSFKLNASCLFNF